MSILITLITIGIESSDDGGNGDQDFAKVRWVDKEPYSEKNINLTFIYICLFIYLFINITTMNDDDNDNNNDYGDDANWWDHTEI